MGLHLVVCVLYGTTTYGEWVSVECSRGKNESLKSIPSNLLLLM